MLYQLYLEMFRVAMVKGDMHLPELPNDRHMPAKELAEAIQRGAKDAVRSTRSNVQGEVHSLRLGEAAADGEVHGR